MDRAHERLTLATLLAFAGTVLVASWTATPAQAQSDWFRPPAEIGTNRAAPQQVRPQTRQQQRQMRQQPQAVAPPPQQRQQQWRPLFPLFDIFRGGDAPPRYAQPTRPGVFGSPGDAAPAEARPRRAAPVEPQEPRGTVYSSIEAARKAVTTQISDVVLVIGDDYATPLAQGLADAFAADRSSAAVIAKAETASGIGPSSQFDWLATIHGGLAGQQEATAIVLFAGSNDLRPITDEVGRAELFDDRWREIYGRRLDELLAALKQHGRPVVVVGLPPVGDSKLSDRNSELNDILKEHAEKAGLIFVDVWDGFTDENGKFVVSGAAVDGARRRLRTADGAGFTRAGGRKLAFFVDRSLGKLLGGAEPGTAAAPGATDVPASGGTIPSIIQLTGAGAGGSAKTLAGAGKPGEPARISGPGLAGGDSPAGRVLVSGEPLAPVLGRADDFRWNPGGAASPTAPAVAAPAPASPAPATEAPATGGPAAPPAP